MSRVFITGGLGDLGHRLVEKLDDQGHELWLLARPARKKSAADRVADRFPHLSDRLHVVEGELGANGLADFKGPLPEVDTIWHVAARLDLSETHADDIWQTNYEGTRTIVNLCNHLGVDRFIYVSTAYTQQRNSYERSKEKAEQLIHDKISDKTRVTIFKPSIIIGTADDPGPLQGVTLVAKAVLLAHRKMESVRRFVEDHMLMPVIEPKFRLQGCPTAPLNIIPVDVVANNMIELMDHTGIKYITNPCPPPVDDVAQEIGLALNVNFRIVPDFRPSIIERLIGRELRPLDPYLHYADQSFPTVVDPDYRIPPGYVTELIRTAFC